MFTRRCHQRVTHRPPNVATRRAMDQVLGALAAPPLEGPPAMSADEAMAERERLRLETEAHRRRQGVLRLSGT
jgi:hypothetical protein